MKLNTKFHGVREYKEEDVIVFHKGIPGFEEYRKFILFPVEENDIFSILQAVEDEEVGIVTVSPFARFKDYELKLSDEKLKDLKITNPDEVLVLNTVTLSSKVEDITTNLKAPIIVNIKEKLGEQIILDNEAYLVKHPLFKE
jgi:flagellar assembly factor FliW